MIFLIILIQDFCRMIWLSIISIWILIRNIRTSVPIGTNTDFLVYNSRSLPYVNLIRQAYGWGDPNAPYILNATFDPTTGWPTSDFGVMIAESAFDLGGKYMLSATGNANVSILGEPNAYITNRTYNSSTNSLTAIINMPEGATDLMLSFINTTGPGLQDIVLLQPGYNLTSKSNITDLMLTHLSRFSIIRFMVWLRINSNFEANWTDTTPLSWPIYYLPRHNPWPTIPYIVNQINKTVDIWINIPFNASDDYILHLARLIFNELNPKSNIYIEFSNEVWNGIFAQSKWNFAAANDSVLNDGDPYHFNYDNCTDPYFWGYRRTAYQIKRVADLFKTVFGDENVGPWKRVRPILAGQRIYLTIIKTGLDYLNAIYGPPSKILHGVAIASYFDLGIYNTWANLTTDQVIEGLNSTLQLLLPEEGWHHRAALGMHATYAAWYKIPVYGYEGGPATASGCPNCSLEAKTNATRDPRMTDLCITHLNGWYRFGFQTMNWFVAGANPVSRFGSWGLLEDMRQETLVDTTTMFNATSPVAQLPRPSPKLKAMDQVRQQSPIEMNFGIPVPSTNINATNYMDHLIPILEPYIAYPQINTTFYYPLKIVQSPIQINITVYVAGKPGILEGAINNEQFVQVETPKTLNGTTFEAAPVMQFKIDLSMVPSVATFRLRVVQKGYSIRSFDILS